MMGTVYADITLKNTLDAGMARRGILKDKEVRQVTVRALVDTGAAYLSITEGVFRELGLEANETKIASYANNELEKCKFTEAVDVLWNDRRTVCQALVIPGANENLLGAIPLEGLDLMVNPVERELIGAHGDKQIALCVGVRTARDPVSPDS
jgi:clan AA aspartic protease